MAGTIILSAVLAVGSTQSTQVTLPVDLGGEPFSVGAFRTELIANDKVGRRRAGLVCAPAGVLRWREAEPVPAKASAAAARAIRDAGVPIDAPEPDDWLDHRVPSTGYRLVGDVVGLDTTMCAPSYGAGRSLDHGRRLKGEGRMRVEWRIYHLIDHAVVARTETCAFFRFDRGGMDTSDVGQIGVIENARILGTALAHQPRGFVLPATLVVAGEPCPPRVQSHRTPDGAADVP